MIPYNYVVVIKRPDPLNVAVSISDPAYNIPPTQIGHTNASYV